MAKHIIKTPEGILLDEDNNVVYMSYNKAELYTDDNPDCSIVAIPNGDEHVGEEKPVSFLYLVNSETGTYVLVSASFSTNDLIIQGTVLSQGNFDCFFISEGAPYEECKDLADTLYFCESFNPAYHEEVGHHEFPDFSGKFVHTINTGDIPF